MRRELTRPKTSSRTNLTASPLLLVLGEGIGSRTMSQRTPHTHQSPAEETGQDLTAVATGNDRGETLPSIDHFDSQELDFDRVLVKGVVCRRPDDHRLSGHLSALGSIHMDHPASRHNGFSRVQYRGGLYRIRALVLAAHMARKTLADGRLLQLHSSYRGNDRNQRADRHLGNSLCCRDHLRGCQWFNDPMGAEMAGGI